MKSEDIKELNKILPVVVRVHGEAHSELITVKELYNELNKAGQSKAEIVKLVNKLKEITKSFEVPQDACPTYARAYELLSIMVSELV